MIVDVGNSTGSSITTTIDPKALPAKNLWRGGRAGIDVSAYHIRLYDNLANVVPKLNKIEKSFVKIS
jgi:hypothetical protein